MDTLPLTTAVAALLADRLGWAWQPNGPAYTSGQVGIFYGAIGPTPDRGVGLTVYGPLDDLATGLAIRHVQIRFRGAPGERAGADALADAAFSVLQGLTRVSGISLAVRVSAAPLGPDENDRQERTDSYQITIDNPEV